MLYLAFLYAALSDPVYDAREHAEATLRHLIDRHPGIYGPVLSAWCKECSEPEVRSRTLRVLRVYDRWRVNSYVPRSTPVWPCIDCLPAANPFVPGFALPPDVRDRSYTARWLCPCPAFTLEPGPYWGRYRAATERMIRERLREGWTAEECDRLLERAWEVEQACRADCSEETWAVSSQWRAWAGGFPR